MGTGGNDATERVWSALSPAARRTLEAELPPADLRSLQLDLARTRAAEVTPASVMRQRQTDRFVRPSSADPRLLHRVESRLWELLPENFQGVELSPVVPLGTCSAVGTIDQNQVVSTVRGTEVVSDPTNALAVEAAVLRRLRPDVRVDLAASHRVLRTQPFTGPGQYAHFELFALVSSARDSGSARTEADLLRAHLRFWQNALHQLVRTGDPVISCTSFTGGAVAERTADTVLPALAEGPVPVRMDPHRTKGQGYYTSAALGLTVEIGDDRIELGDGGFTDWTAQLTGNAKERCLTSCISVERLAQVV
jgi:hypothetical protein